MASRRVGRMMGVLFRVFLGLGVLLVITARKAGDEFVLGPLHATVSQLFLACISVSMAALVVFAFVMPPEVLREDEATIASGRGGRMIKLLPFVFLPIAMILSNLGDFRDQLALGPVHATRYQLVQACNLISIGSWLLLDLYSALRSSRVKNSA